MNNLNAPFLRTSRGFPSDLDKLTLEISKTYIETASAINFRTIGIFPVNKSIITGESWFVSGNQKQQTNRQVYPFGTIAPNTFFIITHGITFFTEFTRIYGTCITSVIDYRPIPYPSNFPNDTIQILVNATQIVIFVGSASPSITSGKIILEWLNNP